MKNKIKYSICLSAYNVDLVVARCLNSLLDTNFNQELYEIIIVNDASTDNTYEIIKSFKNKFINYKIINKKTNENVFKGRISAVNNAIGEYILFIDPDDHVTKNYFIEIEKIDKINTVHLPIKVIRDDGFEVWNKNSYIKKGSARLFGFIYNGDIFKRAVSTFNLKVLPNIYLYDDLILYHCYFQEYYKVKNKININYVESEPIIIYELLSTPTSSKLKKRNNHLTTTIDVNYLSQKYLIKYFSNQKSIKFIKSNILPKVLYTFYFQTISFSEINSFLYLNDKIGEKEYKENIKNINIYRKNIPYIRYRSYINAIYKKITGNKSKWE